MSNDPRPLTDDTAPPPSSHILHALIRFYWVLRRKTGVLVTSLGIAGLLGLLFYATATRIYQSRASLLVLKTGVDVWSPTMTADRTMQDQMATYERLCTSAVVLQGALQRLNQLPPEVNHELQGRWVDQLRELLVTKTLRRTSIIEIGCNSRSPNACVRVLNAVVASYLDFIDKNHRTVATEIVSVLDKERIDLERRIAEKQKELLQAKHICGDLGIKEHARYVHPLVQRVVQLNESLLEVRQQRVRLEASMAAIRRTVDSHGDLRQHFLGLEPLVGKDLILSALGLNGQEAALAAATERELLKDRAALDALKEHYGPRHPRVFELAQRVQGANQYLASFHQRLNDRLAGTTSPELGAMLVSMVTQELAQAQASESRLEREYQRAEADAVGLNDRLANVTIIEHDLQLLRNMHAALVNRIENTDLNQNQANVRVSVINEPVTPVSPVSPSLARTAFFCLVLGTGVGVLIVYVIDVMDDRFRSPEELQEQMGVPLLAMVRKLEERDAKGVQSVQIHVAPNAVESEAFRTLRTTLAFSSDDVGRLAITSAEPGDGKTTVLANLGAAYAQVGKRTLLIDGDLRRPGLTSLFELRGAGGLSEILRSDQSIPEMCVERIRPSGARGLDILPCGPRPSDPAELLSRERFSDLLGWAETMYDQILVDSPPILVASDVAIMGRLIDGVVVVVQPSKNHRRRVLRAVENLAGLGVRLIGVVVNAVVGDSEKGYYGYNADYGYGYGYGYGSGYGQEDQDHALDGEASRGEASRGEAIPGDQSETEPAEAPGTARVVPPRRRAA